MKKKILSFFTLIAICCMAFTFNSCSKDDNTGDDGEEIETGAPDALPVGYVLAKTDVKNSLYYWIRTATNGWHYTSKDTTTGEPLFTSYSYVRTGENTGNFSFSILQIINGPIGMRSFYFTGELTFSAKDKCRFEGTKSYNGTTTKENVDLVILPEKMYPVLNDYK